MIRTYGPGCRDCRYDVVDIPTLDAWPFALYPEHLLLCLDGRAVPTGAIGRLAEELILGGLHAVLCHGPDCERVHDIFDETEVQLEIDGRLDRDPDATILSSWHEYETFADTLFAFAMFRPADSYPIPTVRTVVLVDRPDRARDVHRWLPAFCQRRPS